MLSKFILQTRTTNTARVRQWKRNLGVKAGRVAPVIGEWVWFTEKFNQGDMSFNNNNNKLLNLHCNQMQRQQREIKV